MGGTKGSKGKRQQGKSPAQRAAHVATVAQELADDASKRAAQLEEATEEEQQQQEEQEVQKEEEEEVEETEEERKAEEPKKRARPVPLSSQPQQRSAPLSAPPPHKKPKLQKGDQVPRGATNPIFIAIEHRQHLEYYYSIANKLTRARKAGNNEDWKEEIEHKFDGAGDEKAPFADLNSSPWKDNPGVLLSAWKRVRASEWKWRQVINGDLEIRKGRKSRGFASQPFDDKWQKIAKASKGGKGKKKQGAPQQNRGDKEDDDEDVAQE